jgi:hypothetical protein
MAFGRGPNIVTDGLVLCLDATNPKSYPGIGTDWYDLSGHNNHASLAQFTSPEYITFTSADNYSYFEHRPSGSFWGATASAAAANVSSGAYWNIPSDDSLQPVDGWTVCGWMNVSGSQSHNGCGWFVMDDTDLRIHLEPLSDKFRANSASGWSQIDYNISSYHNKFTFYAFAFDQITGSYATDPGIIRFYINGEEVASYDGFLPTATTDYQISLGRRRGHLQHFLVGDLGSYYYYNKTLTHDRIQEIYNTTKRRFNIE